MDELKIFSKFFKKYLENLIRPKSINDESARKERILNILLISAIVLSVIASLFAGIRYSIAIKNGFVYKGLSGWIVSVSILFFVILYRISQKGKPKLAAYFFVSFFFLSAVYTSLMWGANVPQAILIDALTIVISGILVNTRFAFTIVFLIFFSSLILLSLLNQGIIKYNLLWATKPPEIGDVLVNSITFFIIAIVSWLSNREIIKSLKRARASEKALQKEKNLLETKVIARTKQLEKAQLEKITQVYRFADFGRLASGLFHDLITPLNVVSLNLENIKEETNHFKDMNTKEIKLALKRAVKSTQIIENFVKSVRRQTQGQQNINLFSLNKEIKCALDNLHGKALNLKVQIEFNNKNKIFTYGNQIRFHQIVLNLISNAIDSYSASKKQKDRRVIINLLNENNTAVLKVQDFGSGISSKNLEKIFEPFFTTKNIEDGTGIGLTICKDIIEKDFLGSIFVKSHLKKGTTFTVQFPIKTNAKS